MRPVGMTPTVWRDRFDDIDELRRARPVQPSADEVGQSGVDSSTPIPVAPIPLAARLALIRDIGGRSMRSDDIASPVRSDDAKRQPPPDMRGEVRNSDPWIKGRFPQIRERPPKHPPSASSAAASPAPAAPRHNPGERSSAAAPTVEPPVDAAWLEQRERAFAGLRAEYDAARAAAQADGTGLGWIEDIARGNPNRDRPAADTHPRVEGPDGRVRVFDEQAFAAQFRAQQSAQPGSAMTSLAALYETDATTLLTQHPGLLRLATTEHALNAGPPPPGRAMGNATQLGLLDLYRADPLVAELIDAYGGTPAPAKGKVAQEQLRLFGAERFAQLCRLNTAMGAVRNQYCAALAQAEHRGSGPGWRDELQTVTETDEAGVSHSYQTRTHTFDPDVFTAWYTQQDGLANKAFADFYGQSHTRWEGDNTVGRGGEGGDASVYDPSVPLVAHLRFDNPAWTLQAGGRMQHTSLHPLNINDTPRLNDRNAVGFDVDAGWVTDPRNIHESRDWFETAVTGFIVGVVSYATFGAASTWAAGVFGSGTTTAAVATGALTGMAGSAASGVINGNLEFKDILRGALAGGLTAGLMTQYGAAVQGAAGGAGTIALRTTVQGAIQALLGGSFKDGAIAGFATGLAEVAAANINASIDQAVKSGDMTASEALTARNAARVVGSAIRALGNPNDPQAAFASSFLSDMLQAQQATSNPAVAGNYRNGADMQSDGQGNATPGVVDATAPPAQHALQLAQHLERQGVPADEAAQQALQTIGQRTAAPTSHGSDPPADGGSTQRIEITGQRLPRDALGNAYSTDSAGQQVVYLADGTGLLALGTRAVSITGNSAVPSMALLRALAAESVRAAGTLLTLAGNTGMGAQRVQIDENTRFESRPGELQGQLYERQSDGSWLARDEPHFGFATEMGFRVLSQDELARLRAPIATPVSPPPPPPTPPVPVDRIDASTPGREAAPPAGPNIGTLPAAPPMTVADLLMERSRAEQQRFRNALIDEVRSNSPDFDPRGYEAHHILPLAEYPELNSLRDRLAGWGIDLNDPAINGVLLPGSAEVGQGTVHSDTQRNEHYRDAIRDQFKDVTTRQEAVDALAKIKEELRNGTFVPPKKG
jgi:A nuclease family of the HNH/ENDO VII superfamily with conserved AHH